MYVCVWGGSEGWSRCSRLGLRLGELPRLSGDGSWQSLLSFEHVSLPFGVLQFTGRLKEHHRAAGLVMFYSVGQKNGDHKEK